MTIEVKSGIADGMETVVLNYIGGDEYEVQESLEAHLALGFELDGREYTDALGSKHRILTRPSDEPDAVIEDEVNATKAALALAEENGLDLSWVEGSGSDGRIGVGDVRDFLAAWEDIDEPEEESEEEGDEEIPSSEDEEPEEEVEGSLPFEEFDEEDEDTGEIEVITTEDVGSLEELLPIEEVEGSIKELEEGE